MAKGGKIISDSFQINLETQISLQILGSCESQVGGYIEITFENLDAGTSLIVCKSELNPNSIGANAGFTLRLVPGRYKWTSRFNTITSLSKPKQEGEVHIYDELHGEIEYGRIGVVWSGAYGNSYFIFSALGNIPINLTARANSNNAMKGTLKIKNLSNNSEISTPKVLTSLNNSNGLITELIGIAITPYQHYKATFEIEFDNIDTINQHNIRIN